MSSGREFSILQATEQASHPTHLARSMTIDIFNLEKFPATVGGSQPEDEFRQTLIVLTFRVEPSHVLFNCSLRSKFIKIPL